MLQRLSQLIKLESNVARVIALVLLPLATYSVFYLPNDLKTLPKLGDSVVALVTMKHGLGDFPDLPVFYPATGAYLYGEALYLQSFIYNVADLFFDEFTSYNLTLLILASLNVSVIALYLSNKLNLSIIESFVFAFIAGSPSFMFDFPGQLQLWVAGFTIILSIEMVHFIQNKRLSIWIVASCFSALALSSATFFFIFFAMYVSAAALLPAQAYLELKRLSKSRVNISFVIVTAILSAIVFYFYTRGGASSYSIDVFENFDLSTIDILGYVFGFGHFDNVNDEASRYTVLGFLGLATVIFARSFLRFWQFFSFFALLAIFLLLSMGPTIDVGSGSIRNFVFEPVAHLPGFGSIRVVSKYLIVSSSLLAAAFIIFYRNISRRLPLAAVAALAFVAEMWPHITRTQFQDVPFERMETVQMAIDTTGASAVVHLPIYDGWPVSYHYMIYVVQDDTPMVNGVLSFFPPSYYEIRDSFNQCAINERMCDAFFERMDSIDVGLFFVHPYFWEYAPEASISPERFLELCEAWHLDRATGSSCIQVDGSQ